MERTASCPSCQRGVFAEDAFCSWCGASIQERGGRTGESRRALSRHTVPTRDRQNCASCNSPVLPGDEFCSTCGARTGAPITVAGLSESWRALGRRLGEASRGKYQIVRELGRGGMGVVLMARDTELERRVAIKVLAPSLLGDEAMVTRFQREARTIASLRHQSIVSLYDVGRAGDLHYFVMDFIEGVSLSRVLRVHGPLPIPVVQTFLLQVGSALAYAHRPGRTVIHRDIKPSNIMIDPEGTAVVTDFGISKVTERPEGLTRTGVVIGTPEYMSPEQCRGTTVTPASDQYSLGAVVFAMLTGAPPFTGAFYKVLGAHQNETVPSVREVRPDCPMELAEATERMMAKRPTDRWASIREALRALRLQTPLSGDPVLESIAELVRSTEGEEVGADGAGPGPPSRPPASVEITPLPSDLEIGDQLDLRATVLFEDGGHAAPSDVAWESTDPSILRIDSDTGELVAVGAGEARVTARVAGVSRSVDLAVREAAVADLIVEPDVLELEVGESRAVTAEPLSRRGEPLDRRVIWSSSNPRTVSVSELGVVEGHREGTVNVLAHCQGCGASLQVAVVPAAVAEVEISGAGEFLHVGDSLILEAHALDRRGRRLDRAMTWTSSATRIAEVNPEGRVRALSEGEVEIHARCEDRHASVTIQVLPVPVASLAIDDEPGLFAVGDRATLRAVACDREGRVLDREVEWSSERPDLLRVEPDGTIEGVDEGRVEVTATCEDQVARVAIEVQSPPITRIEVSAPPDELLVGDTFHLEATMYDRRGDAREGFPEWTVDEPEVLDLLAPGLFRAARPGDVVVTASAGALSTRVPLTIGVEEPVVVEEFGVADAAAPVPAGEAPTSEREVLETAATERLAEHPAARAGQPPLDPATSSSPPPLYRRPAAWVGTVVVVVAGAALWMPLPREGAAPSPRVEEVRIVAADGQELPSGPIEVTEGESLALAGLAFGADRSRAEEVVPRFGSSDALVARVDSSGHVMAVGPGSATVEARVGDVADSISVVVTARPDEIVIVRADGRDPIGDILELDADETVQLRGRVTDRRGEEMEVPVSWSSSGEGTATVDGAGVVRGVSLGTATITAVVPAFEQLIDDVHVNVSSGPSDTVAVQPAGPAWVTVIVEDAWAFVTLDGSSQVDTLQPNPPTAGRKTWELRSEPNERHTFQLRNDRLPVVVDTTVSTSPGSNDTIRVRLRGRGS